MLNSPSKRFPHNGSSTGAPPFAASFVAHVFTLAREICAETKGGITVISAVFVCPEFVAVIVTVPVETPITTPSLVIIATDSSLDSQVVLPAKPFSTVAVSAIILPIYMKMWRLFSPSSTSTG